MYGFNAAHLSVSVPRSKESRWLVRHALAFGEGGTSPKQVCRGIHKLCPEAAGKKKAREKLNSWGGSP